MPPSFHETWRIVDEVADRFEAAWRAFAAGTGERPDVEAFVAGAPAEALALLREELQAIDEQQRRRVDGESSAPMSAGAAGSPSAAPHAPRVGSRVGTYVIERTLGAGAMGTVYLAYDSVLDRRVALKIIKLGRGVDDAEKAKSWLREARAAARLNHANVATVYEVGRGDDAGRGDEAFISMEYVERGSLADELRERARLPWREAARTVRDAAAGLAAAHAAGLVHRDVKPSNLMRCRDGSVKLVDFGLARFDEGLERTRSVAGMVGSPAYMSPEQCRGEAADARSDVYSLTCAFYHLLTGALPFKATSAESTIYGHVYAPFPDPRDLTPDVPRAVAAVVARGSQKDPAARFASADELRQRLDAILQADGEPPAEPPPATRHRFGRRALAFAALVVVVVVVVVAAALAGIGSQRSRRPQAVTTRPSTVASTSPIDGITHELRSYQVSVWSERGLGHLKQSEYGLALLCFARAVECAGDDAEASRLPRVQFNALLHARRWPRPMFSDSPPSVPRDANFSEDGRTFVYSSSNRVIAWDVGSGRVVGQVAPTLPATTQPTSDTIDVNDAALSPDGKTLAVVGARVGKSDSRTGWAALYEFPHPRLRRWQELSRSGSNVTYSSTGGRILVESSDGTSVALDGALAVASPINEPWLHPARSTPDGRLAIKRYPTTQTLNGRTSSQVDCDVVRRPVDGGESQTVLKLPYLIHKARLSSRGTDVLYIGSSSSLLRPVADNLREPWIVPFRFRSGVFDFDWDEPARRAAFVTGDGTIQLTDLSMKIGDEPAYIGQVTDPDARLVRLSRDGKTFVTVDLEGTASVWDVAERGRLTFDEFVAKGRPAGAAPVIRSDPAGPDPYDLTHETIQTSVDGKWIVNLASPNEAGERNVKQHVVALSVEDPSVARALYIEQSIPFGNSSSVFFDPTHAQVAGDGGRILIDTMRVLVVMDLKGGTIVTVGPRVPHALLTSDGKHVVTLNEPEGISRWDATTGTRVNGPFGGRLSGWYTVGGEQFSPDGRWAITSDADSRGLRVWDVATGRQVATVPHANNNRLLWTAKNELLVGGEWPAKTWIRYDPATGEPTGAFLKLPFAPHAGWLDASRRYLAAAGDGRLVVFDLEREAIVGTPIPFKADQQAWAILSPDASVVLIVRCSLDALTKPWIDAYDVSSGRALAWGISVGEDVTGAVFPRDHPVLVTSALGVTSIDLSPTAWSGERCVGAAEVVTQQRVDENGFGQPIPVAERRRLWQDVANASTAR